MGIVTANLALSLDGCAAGPSQSLEQPFGSGITLEPLEVIASPTLTHLRYHVIR